MSKESEILRNEPIKLFKVGGKMYEVKVLPIGKADAWLEQADAVGQTEAEIAATTAEGPGAARARKRAHAAAIFDAVFAYDPEALPRGEIEAAGVTAEQMIDAFLRLKAATDPFEIEQVKNWETIQRQLSGLPQHLVEKALSSVKL